MHKRTSALLMRLCAGTAVGLLVGSPVAYAYDTAAATAAANGEACEDVGSFYWEIGGPTGGPIVSGQVGSGYTRTTKIDLASASKWIFAAYVLERYNGLPGGASGADIVDALNMKLGYTNLNDLLCEFTLTVKQCFTIISNDDYDSAADGHFFYNSGHGQYVAQSTSHLNLPTKTRSTLFSAVDAQLNLGSSFSYSNLPLSSGLAANAADYAAFLQTLMTGGYVLSDYLSYSPVATYPCDTGLSGCTPLGSVDFHYSLHHWIEDNTGGTLAGGKTLAAGDGAHSSPGAFGFYPWITADMQYYGIISVKNAAGGFNDTVPCGQAIRAAFLDE
ncbi:MAG: hypothetical protein H6923_10180 [Alphaproteobacteria bacterium]|nr:hypothetical protein [Alphaproteobacteria bacterium]